jgi:hypothetical protein
VVRFGIDYRYDHWPELLAALARRLEGGSRMRQLTVDMFSTDDGYGLERSSSGRPGPGDGLPDDQGSDRERPVFAELPDLDLDLTDTSVIDERPELLDYRVADRPGEGGG